MRWTISEYPGDSSFRQARYRGAGLASIKTRDERSTEIGASDKPTMIVFNKTDAYRYIEKEPDDLTPSTDKNIPLAELERTWMGRVNAPSVFISATRKQNISQFRELIFGEVRRLYLQRYPQNQVREEGNP